MLDFSFITQLGSGTGPTNDQPTGSNVLPGIAFSDPPTQAQLERLIFERWHTRPDWLYGGNAPKTLTNNLAELPVALTYDSFTNRITVSGTVAEVSGWDFAATQTEIYIDTGQRIDLVENCRFAPEIVTKAQRTAWTSSGRCIFFSVNGTGSIGILRKCLFTKVESSDGGFDVNGWAIYGGHSSGNNTYPRIDLMEYCSFEGAYTDPLKGIWGGDTAILLLGQPLQYPT